MTRLAMKTSILIRKHAGIFFAFVVALAVLICMRPQGTPQPTRNNTETTLYLPEKDWTIHYLQFFFNEHGLLTNVPGEVTAPSLFGKVTWEYYPDTGQPQ